MNLKINLFDYNLPQSAVAQVPAPKRDHSRLLRIDRQSGQISHHRFFDFPELLPDGSNLFRNTARVFKARLKAQLPNGGAIECLLLHRAKTENTWWCLLRPGRKARPGRKFGAEGVFTATVLEQTSDGQFRIAFEPEGFATVLEMAEKHGEMPLPHYIKRPASNDLPCTDTKRYQTVYSDPNRTVAAAAPTAGLHFTKEILQRIENRGIASYDLTLHIGLGTFKPIQAETIEGHQMHREFHEISQSTRRALHSRKKRPRVAIGTTSVRAIEDYLKKTEKDPNLKEMWNEPNFSEEADLFIYPPYRFSFPGLLLTNFHLPRSTLMCLVSAFLTPDDTAGIKWLKEIYREAIVKDYKFYSYGDAMFIL